MPIVTYYIIAHVHSDPVQLGKIARLMHEGDIPKLYADRAAAVTALENYGLMRTRYRVWEVTLSDEPLTPYSVDVGGQRVKGA